MIRLPAPRGEAPRRLSVDGGLGSARAQPRSQRTGDEYRHACGRQDPPYYLGR